MAKADNTMGTVSPADFAVMQAAAKDAGLTVQVMYAVSNAEFFYFLERESEAAT